MEEILKGYFHCVFRLASNNKRAPVWQCMERVHDRITEAPFTPDEIAVANIRPGGAVGRNAIVPRIVQSILRKEIEEAQTVCK